MNSFGIFVLIKHTKGVRRQRFSATEGMNNAYETFTQIKKLGFLQTESFIHQDTKLKKHIYYYRIYPLNVTHFTVLVIKSQRPWTTITFKIARKHTYSLKIGGDRSSLQASAHASIESCAMIFAHANDDDKRLDRYPTSSMNASSSSSSSSLSSMSRENDQRTKRMTVRRGGETW